MMDMVMGVRKYFDHAYEGFCNSMQPFIRLAEVMEEVAKIVFVYTTLPIWIIPYRLFLRRKEKQNENTKGPAE